MTSPANITRAGARRRMYIAGGALMLACAGAWVMTSAEMDRSWRIAYFPTFWLVGLCLFQAYEKTCVVLVVKGERETEDGGHELVPPDVDVVQLKCQAQRVHLHALLFAALCTALMLAIGEL